MSADFEEVATICHRAIDFSRGRVVDELRGVARSTETLIQAASAGDEAASAKKIAMNPIQSDALEPTRDELAGLTRVQKLIRLAPVYGLVILTVF